MQGRHLLLAILLAAAAVAGGCTAPDTIADLQPDSPAPSPLLTVMQTVLTGLPAPTPAAPVRENTALEAKRVGFVDPAAYHIPTPTPTIAMTRQPSDLRVSEKMVEYAKVTADYPPGLLATEIYHIPFPYWDLSVSATPLNAEPWLSVEVYGNDDPNRLVEKIQYSRSEIGPAENNTVTSSTTGNSTTEMGKAVTIREGYGDFYLIIRSGSLKSLTITVRIPEKYLV